MAVLLAGYLSALAHRGTLSLFVEEPSLVHSAASSFEQSALLQHFITSGQLYNSVAAERPTLAR
eukprot:1870522-Pleurochrysis_carterae.AAC.1